MPLKLAQVYSHIPKSLFRSINVMDFGFFPKYYYYCYCSSTTQDHVKHFISQEISFFFFFIFFKMKLLLFSAAITQLVKLDMTLPNVQCTTQILQHNAGSYSYSAMFFTFKSTAKHLFASPEEKDTS